MLGTLDFDEKKENMNMTHEYSLSASVQKRLETRMKKQLVCEKCGRELKVGDAVISKQTGSHWGTSSKHYHRKCFKDLWR